MKLSHVTSRYRKIFLCGSAGNGKTVGAASFPGSTYWFDFDDGLESIQTYYGKVDPSRIEAIDYDTYNDPIPEKPIAYKAFEKKVTEFQEYVKKHGRMPFDNIVLDSLTTLQTCLTHYIKVSNPDSGKRVFGNVNNLQDYLILGHFLKELFPEFLALPCNVIVTAHVKTTNDDTGAIYRDPLVTGKDLPELIPLWFSEAYYCVTGSSASDPKDKTIQYLWQFRPDKKVRWAKSRMLPANHPSPTLAGYVETTSKFTKWKAAADNLTPTGKEDAATTTADMKAAATSVGIDMSKASANDAPAHVINNGKAAGD